MAERDIRGLDVAMLRTFAALMRERSVSRAAARLFLSQPAVSASLNRLRRTFGDPLFTRTAHGVAPTDRAHALAPAVERVLADLAALLDGGSAFDPAASQRVVRIAGTDHSSRLMLPPLAAELARLGSRMRIVWETGGIGQLTERLRRHDVDLAVLPHVDAPREVESALLYADRYVLAARHGHPTLAAPPSLDVFCMLPHVVLGLGVTTLDDRIDALLQRSGHGRHCALAVATFGQMVDVLARTDHVAVMPQRVAAAHAERLTAHALPVVLPDYRLFLCWSRRSHADAALAWVREQLVSAIRTSSAAPAASSAAAAPAAPRARRRAASPRPESPR